MIYPQNKNLSLNLPALLLLLGLGGGLTSSCTRPGGVQAPPPESNVQSVSPKLPVIPAPELTTLASPSSAANPQRSQAPRPKLTKQVRPTQQAKLTQQVKPTQKAKPQPKTAFQPTAYQADALALPPKPAQASPRVPIRVAIAQQSPSLMIGTSIPAAVIDQQGQPIKTLGTAAETFVVKDGQLQIGAQPAPNVVWIKPESEAGLVYVSGRWYRGAIQVIAAGSQLLGVNHLDMESYLYSVVGAEMPASWPLEALKSQAIAARSYALAHIARPADSSFDLGDTQRWQAYKGVETETGSTLAAVEATSGMVLSHNGAVVESLYAASDQIVREVHKGFGMSQNGANQLAQQHYNFQQILAHFYPGTRLAWLQISS